MRAGVNSLAVDVDAQVAVDHRVGAVADGREFVAQLGIDAMGRSR